MHPNYFAVRVFFTVVPLFFLTLFSNTAIADWNPDDDFKMHFPQEPDPEGWDICLIDQWLADDFRCTESGPIRDIHFWISWQNDFIAEINPGTFDVQIYSDAGGMPGVPLWGLSPGTANFTVRPYGTGLQGWNCPINQFVMPNDHFDFYQVNITQIQEPFVQEAGSMYWLVLRAQIFPPVDTAVGWKTSTNDPPIPPFGSPARWSPDLINWPFIETPFGAVLLHDLSFVITDTGGPDEPREYGDAPEGALAYPSLGVIGAFPTCRNVPVAGFIEHNNFGAWFGLGFDFEPDGNAGFCPVFNPNSYDQDECFDAPIGLVDAGLLFPEPFTIVGPIGGEVVVPCPNSNGTPLGLPCTIAQWGGNIDIHVENHMPNQTIGYVNVLVDWDQNGVWSGASPCPGAAAPEHILVDHLIPNGFVGPLSALAPPPFVIGPQTGYVWVRFSITERPVGPDWDGTGVFEDGETEDYLLWIDGLAEEFDWGDLPDPYPTLAAANGPNHFLVPNMALGAGVDPEPDGQPDPAAMGDDNDTVFPPPNDDEDGITFVTTLIPGQQAIIDVTNNMVAGGTGFLEGWIDFNNDGSFAEAGDQVFFSNPLSPAPINFNSFLINVPPSATPGPTYARFRFSSNPVGYGVTGPAQDGEVEDYQIRIEAPPPIMACCLPDGSCIDTTHMDCVVNLIGDPLGPGTNCATVTCHPLKWVQPPLFDPVSTHSECFYGWDEISRYRGLQIVADDWLCLDEGPIANIHWWGSYENWEDVLAPQVAPSLFHIGLWTDQPAGPGGDPPSHPQTMIWEWIVPRSELNERPVACDFEPDHMQTPDGCFRYDFDIPPDQWFFQEPGETIYWISISAIYDDTLCPCIGDISGDGVIDASDLAAFTACFGQPPTGPCANADLDCDGDIDSQDLAIFMCWFNNCAGPNPDIPACQRLCCPTIPAIPEFPWGWKTRPHFYNDFAQRVLLPTDPIPGSEYLEGEIVEAGWDMAFVITSREPEPPLIRKWSQLPHDETEGFDARSDIAFFGPEDDFKWQQLPDSAFAGLHAHDSIIVGVYDATTLADQWICEGGVVTKLVWYGDYELYSDGTEKRNSGISFFNVAIYQDDGNPMPFCLPNQPLWSTQVGFASANETNTGLTNNEGCAIYKYTVELPPPDWFEQEPGNIYWLAIGAISNDANAAAIWRWERAGPGTMPPTVIPTICFNASRTLSMPAWTSGQSELAFEIISAGPVPAPDPNRVVADDFISDGRPIEAVRWWGSYLDDRFAPLQGPIEPFVVDGWLISFHHARPEADCPPDALAGDDPTALGVYFAPTAAVSIVPMGYADCLGHDVYGYAVDLSQCCLLCAEADPRDGNIPAEPDAFLEVRGFTYWIDVQAIVGLAWDDTGSACTPIFTGHLPSDLPGLDRHFWGWHTSPGPVAPCSPLNEACFGYAIAPSVAIPPSDCPDYNDWRKQPWECDTPVQEVQMAFELLTTQPEPCVTCPGDMDGNTIIDGRDIHHFVQCLIDSSLTWQQCACGDVDCSKTVTLNDIDAFVALLLSGATC